MKDFQRFDSKNLFIDALSKGLTIFCGAGFSVLAKDENEKFLPTGEGLLEELKTEFSDVSAYKNLSKACTKIIRTNKKSFYDYLEHRFKVFDFEPLYLALTNVKIRSIYTTNIDDLWYKIYEKSNKPIALYNRSKGAEINYDNKISYFPLHGCIRTDNEYIFGSTEIAGAFSRDGLQASWRSLAKDASNNAILFWGWNFEDSGPIEAM